MTSNNITFCFNRETNSALRYTAALRGTTRIAADGARVTTAVTTVFDKLIERNADKYEKAILSLNRFTVTLIDKIDHSSLKIVSENVVIRVKILLPETAALFLDSISTLQPKVTQPPLQPIAQPTLQVVMPSSTKTTTPVVVSDKTTTQPPLKPVQVEATTKPIAPQIVPVTPKADPYIDIFIDMDRRFSNTLVMLPESGKTFGGYLMERLFGKAKSYDYKKETGDFTITFEKEQNFNLTKLPEKASDKTKKELEQLQGSTLIIPKQVKGKFSGNKVSFEPGSLTISWIGSWVKPNIQLLEIYETGEGRITMRVNVTIKELFISVSAQDFADFVECNIT